MKAGLFSIIKICYKVN